MMISILLLGALFGTPLGPLTLSPGVQDKQKPARELAASWRVVLESPGGELPFRLDLFERSGELNGIVHNGEERIRVGDVQREGSSLVLRMAPYDSYLHLQVSADGASMSGRWEKFVGKNRKSHLPVRAKAGALPRFPLTPLTTEQQASLNGRWAVQFATDDSLAVGHFNALEDGTATGTFETTLGDYRFLAGSFDGARLRLSCFDGGHAFLFEARIDEAGALQGGFWSRDSWHETWSATKDPNAELPDSFALTQWTGDVSLADLSFPDLAGKSRKLTDPAFTGRARIISLFGTWCPNCNDEAKFLAELDRKYGDRGLSILGLAFELDDDHERSKRQIQRFTKRHGVHYPILIAGTSDKALASKAFPALDKVRAYPTAIFLDSNGKVRAIHTGFSGPATGASHEHMKERYELLIEELLGPAKGQ